MGEGVTRPHLSLQKVRYLNRFEVSNPLPQTLRSGHFGASPFPGGLDKLSSSSIRMAAARRPSSRLRWKSSSSPMSTVRRSAARPTHGPASAHFAALRSDDLIGCDAVSAAASATPDTPVAFLIASMILSPSPPCTRALSHGLPSFPPVQARQRLAPWQGDHYADAYRQVGMLEAALLALRAACGAAACPGRRALWNCEHALAKSRMRSCMDDRLCICPYGVAMSPGPRVLDSTHRKLPPMYNP